MPPFNELTPDDDAGGKGMPVGESVRQSLSDSDPILAGCITSNGSSSPIFDFADPLRTHVVEISLCVALETYQQFSDEIGACSVRKRQNFRSKIIRLDDHHDRLAPAVDSVPSPSCPAAAQGADHRPDQKAGGRTASVSSVPATRPAWLVLPGETRPPVITGRREPPARLG